MTHAADGVGLVGVVGDVNASLDARLHGLGDHGERPWKDRGLVVRGASGRAACGDWTCLTFGRITYRGSREPVRAEELVARVGREGEGLLSELRGEFVALFWERNRQTGFVAVDQLGAQSLYWARAGGGVAFAADLRDLLALLPQTPAPERTSVLRFLAIGTVGLTDSMLTGVQRLPGGRLLQLLPPEVRRYWTPRYAGVLAGTRDELAEVVRAELIETVKARMPEGRPVGIMLSGGLDSTAVAVAARAAAADAEIRAYSGVFENQAHIDESALISLTARRIGAGLTLSHISGGRPLVGALEHIAAWRLPPTAPMSFLWPPLLRRVAADGTMVLLDGQGGDELFGVAPYLIADHLRRGGLRAARATAGRIPGVGRSHDRRTLDRIVRAYGLRAALPTPLQRLLYHRRDRRRPSPSWIAQADVRRLDAAHDPWTWTRARGPRWWAQLAYVVTDLRHEMDVHGFFSRRFRQFGVTGAHPLLQDLDLVELALRLPPTERLGPDYDRPLLRAAISGLAPDEILRRTEKSEFGSLFIAGMRGPDRPLAAQLIASPAARIAEYTDHARLVGELLDGAPVEPGGTAASLWAQQLWRAASLEIWLRELSDPGHGAELMTAHGPTVDQTIEVVGC